MRCRRYARRRGATRWTTCRSRHRTGETCECWTPTPRIGRGRRKNSWKYAPRRKVCNFCVDKIDEWTTRTWAGCGATCPSGQDRAAAQDGHLRPPSARVDHRDQAGALRGAAALHRRAHPRERHDGGGGAKTPDHLQQGSGRHDAGASALLRSPFARTSQELDLPHRSHTPAAPETTNDRVRRALRRLAPRDLRFWKRSSRAARPYPDGSRVEERGGSRRPAQSIRSAAQQAASWRL